MFYLKTFSNRLLSVFISRSDNKFRDSRDCGKEHSRYRPHNPRDVPTHSQEAPSEINCRRKRPINACNQAIFFIHTLFRLAEFALLKQGIVNLSICCCNLRKVCCFLSFSRKNRVSILFSAEDYRVFTSALIFQ